MCQARRVEPVILAEGMQTHISHASGSVSRQVSRLGFEPRPVGVVAVHAAMPVRKTRLRVLVLHLISLKFVVGDYGSLEGLADHYRFLMVRQKLVAETSGLPCMKYGATHRVK